MKQTLRLLSLALLLILSATTARSQYWQKIDGPNETVKSLTFRDTLVLTQIGGTYYSFDSRSGIWKQYAGFITTPPKLTLPTSLQHLSISATFRNDTAYVASYDTVYFTSDLGFTWKKLGSFGDPNTGTIMEITQLPGGATVMQNALGTIYTSYNAFRTFETSQLPAGANPKIALKQNADTLFYLSNDGRLSRSSDLGKNWEALTMAFDTMTDRWTFYAFKDLYVVEGNQGHLEYSLDGQTYQKINVPDTQISTLRYDGTWLYLMGWRSGVDWNYYRSNDRGKTWQSMTAFPETMTVDGTIYTYGPPFSYSIDHGGKWQTMLTRGYTEKTTSIERWKDTTYLCTDLGLRRSLDNGLTWSEWSTLKNGVLGHGTKDSLTFNTVNIMRSYGSGYHRLNVGLAKPTFGVYTDSGNIWVEDQGELWRSFDSGASFLRMTMYEGDQVKALFGLSGDSVLAVYRHAIWKYKDFVNGVKVSLPGSIIEPVFTGAAARDSGGAFYVATTTGSLFVSRDRAATWSIFPSPTSTPTAVVTDLAAGPGMLWAVTMDTVSSATQVHYYDTSKVTWTNVTSNILGEASPKLTKVWYVGGYAYVGTSNLGTFRSVKRQVAEVRSPTQFANVSVYPDPVVQFANLIFEDNTPRSISVVDATGREVMLECTHGGNATLECRALPPGMYVARISSVNGVQTVKFVKQ